MDFGLSEEQRMLRDSVSKFMQKECPPEYVRECDEKETYPQKLFDKMAKLGWMGLPFPEEYGGTGGSVLDLTIVIEELARYMVAAAQLYGGSVVFGGLSILDNGTKEQKEHYLPKIARGEIQFSLAMTEPDAGSDAASIRTKAVKDGKQYVINGSKTFCSRAHHANWLIVTTKTDLKAAKKHQGITMFLVDPKSPGVVMRKIKKLGHRATDWSEIFFEDVRVPEENILGRLNRGWPNLVKTLEHERIYISAFSVGPIQALVDKCIQYSMERVQFERPIAKFQLIQSKLADMQVKLDAARLLTYRAAWLCDQSLPFTREASEAKLFASEAYTWAASQAIQIHGGYGCAMESDIQRHYRDSKMLEIGGGTSEIIRIVIAREMYR